jgi:excisionase family DNA binding protein
MDELLTVDQVAARLQLSVDTIYRWLRIGRLKGVRPGGKTWRISTVALAAFMESCTPYSPDGEFEQWIAEKKRARKI